MKNQVVILSRNHLLGYHLGLKFAQSELNTELYHLSPSAVVFKDLDPKVHQQNYTPETVISPADYFLVIYPLLSDLSLITHLTQIISTTNAKLCIVINYRDQKIFQVINSHLPKTINSRFIILTDPYGPYFNESTDPLSHLITSATRQATLEVTDSGKQKLYPTYIGDITSPILKTLFTSGTSGQTFVLSTLESTTNLNIAYQLVNLGSEVLGASLQLSVIEDVTPVTPLDTDGVANTQNQLNWEPLTDIETGLRQTLLVAAPPPEELKPKAPPPKPKVDLAKLPPLERKVRRFFNPKAWMIVTFLVAIGSLISLPIILFIINSYLGATHLTKAISDLQQGSTTKSHKLAQQATADFGRSRVLLQSSNPILLIIPTDTVSQTDKLLDALSRLSVVITTASDTVGQAEGLYQIILGGSINSFTPAITQLKSSLDTLYSELSLVKVSLEKIDLSNSLEIFNTLSSAKKQIPDMLSQLQLGIASLDLLPQMIGSSSPQTYLVLLQNSAELRPTGGFLSSYALVTFQNGHLIDIKVDDVYNADSQLSGHVEPPLAIKKYLGESNWYLRDSNWYPSFPNTARQIQWFIGKEINRDVQGVVALNLYSVRDLLQASGPLSVSEFQETISAENLFERVEYRSEVNFFPGTTQKRDFLSALYNQLLQQVKSGRIPLAKLTAALDHSLRGRQIFIMTNDSQVQNSLEALGFSGSIKAQPCPSAFATSPCTSATFALIEANLGVNKTNYFLERNIKNSVTLEKDGRLNYAITVSYKNKSETTAWPGGRYKTFTRFYVPEGTEVVSVQLAKTDIVPESVTTIPDLGLTEIALYYEIPVNTSSDLEISLRGSQIVTTQSSSSSLVINWLKQSGTGDDPITINLNYPSNIMPTQMSLPADNPPQQLNFSTLFKGNLTFAIQFVKK